MEPLWVLTDVSKQDLFPSKQVISGESLSCWFEFERLDDCSSSHRTCQAIASLTRVAVSGWVGPSLGAATTSEAFEVAPAADPESP